MTTIEIIKSFLKGNGSANISPQQEQWLEVTAYQEGYKITQTDTACIISISRDIECRISPANRKRFILKIYVNENASVCNTGDSYRQG